MLRPYQDQSSNSKTADVYTDVDPYHLACAIDYVLLYNIKNMFDCPKITYVKDIKKRRPITVNK